MPAELMRTHARPVRSVTLGSTRVSVQPTRPYPRAPQFRTCSTPRHKRTRPCCTSCTRQPARGRVVTRRVSVSLSRFKTYNDETRDSRELATAANRERSGYRLIAPGSRVRPRPRRCGTARPAGGSRGAVEPPRSRSPPRDARTARSTPERPLSAIGIAVI